MKTSPFFLRASASWAPLALGSGAYRRWLRDSGSLTRRLQAHCRHFSVEAVSQRWACPERDEAVLLGLRGGEAALLREVTLCCDGVPAVFAHSVLPRASLRGEWQRLARLESRPLGGALFADPGVVRTPLTFRRLGPGSALYRRASRRLAAPPRCLWARRSLFILDTAPILVTEVFLPAVLRL